MIFALGILVVVGGAIVVVLWCCRSVLHVGDILSNKELREKYGFAADARPEINIDARNVPEQLRDLIPMAETWGIGDDVIRVDFEDKASEAEKVAFREALRGRCKRVQAWLSSFGTDLSEDAVPFMYMLEALDEIKLWPDSC